MIGFDGDPGRVARVHEAVLELVRVFPEHLAKPQPPSWTGAEDIASNEQFEGIVRAHKKDRLSLPIQALLRVGASHANFDHMPLRRLAFFVPALLSGWLDRAAGDVHIVDIEHVARATLEVEGEWWAWTDEEAAALDTFFDAALGAALATPLPPRRAPDRPLEDGLQVWSFHAPSVPLEVLRAARALRVATEPLVVAWVSAETRLAEDHLLEAVFDPTVSAKHWLAEEPVAERLAEAFFAATGERAVRLSKAEKHVRRWIARRDAEV